MRGNLVRIRDCPAAVCRNERRRDSERSRRIAERHVLEAGRSLSIWLEHNLEQA